MKQGFTGFLKYRSGTCKHNEVTFVANKRKDKCYARRWYPRTQRTEHNLLRGEIFKSASRLYKQISPVYKDALKTYANAYNQQVKPYGKFDVSGYNIWIMAVCKNPAPISNISEIINSMGDTIEAWVNAGYLPAVQLAQYPDAQLNA